MDDSEDWSSIEFFDEFMANCMPNSEQEIPYPVRKQLDNTKDYSVLFDCISVPKDVLILILSRIDIKSWKSVKSTCRSFRELGNAMYLPSYVPKSMTNAIASNQPRSVKFLLDEGVIPNEDHINKVFNKLLPESFSLTDPNTHLEPYEKFQEKNRKRRLQPAYQNTLTIFTHLAPHLNILKAPQQYSVIKRSCKQDDELVLKILIDNFSARQMCESECLEVCLKYSASRCYHTLINYYLEYDINPLALVEEEFLMSMRINRKLLQELITSCFDYYLVSLQRSYITTLFVAGVVTNVQGSVLANMIKSVHQSDVNMKESLLEDLFLKIVKYSAMHLVSTFIERNIVPLNAKIFREVMMCKHPDIIRTYWSMVQNKQYKISYDYVLNLVRLNVTDVLKTVLGKNSKKLGYVLIGTDDQKDELLEQACKYRSDDSACYLLQTFEYDFSVVGKDIYRIVWLERERLPKTLLALQSNEDIKNSGITELLEEDEKQKAKIREEREKQAAEMKRNATKKMKVMKETEKKQKEKIQEKRKQNSTKSVKKQKEKKQKVM